MRASRSEGGAAPRGRRGRPGSPRARLFVALDPEPEARVRLAAWRDRLVAGRDDLRPVGPEALHVTLAFLGYRPEREIPAIASAVARAACGHPAPALDPGAVRPLPPRAPRLFALDLGDARGECAALQADVVRALAAGRFHEPERRPFWPHVTLARVKRERRAAPLDAAAAGEPPAPLAFEAVVLYRSLLRPQGARYEALERLELGRRA